MGYCPAPSKQTPHIKEGQTIQWPKETRTHIDLQSNTQKDLDQYEPHKKQGANKCFERGGSSCSTSGTCQGYYSTTRISYDMEIILDTIIGKKIHNINKTKQRIRNKDEANIVF